ncbi:atrial natriuretic peptide receptor 1-like [Paramacrobiotus metropolitanus]|uniref:atrial natriuretic peptide receptor 1-like n=1 Tax=Paramacrobiotus metropolitanus TaxID=2943436 RepID=UPI00244592C0|nr:atrial natriuretic peptide receptor 1-like [Paramacrobiotus metropolitanus]
MCKLQNYVYFAHLLSLGIGVVSGNGIFRLHLITVLNGDNRLFGYYAVGPLYDVAFRQIITDYPYVFSHVHVVHTNAIHEPGMFNCPEGAANILTTTEKIYAVIQQYPHYFTVIFFPGCSLEVLALGDFAREWDVTLIAALAGDQALANKQRYPTVVTFPAPDHVTMPAGFELFAETYKWRTITFLCDGLSQFQAMSTFYFISCSNIKRKLEASTRVQYQINKLEFDSKFNQDYETLLRLMQPQSRVAIIFSHPRIVRDIMVTAHRLNMTNGDYIFLTSQTTRVPQMTDMNWQFFDGSDEAAFDGFRSLISFVNPNPNWDRIQDVLDEAKNISLIRYNRTVTRDDQLNDISISAYESVIGFAQVLNDTLSEVPNMTGTQFARKFWDRSFDFPSRSFHIGRNGMRVNDVVFSRLNTTSGIVEDTWRYYAVPKTLEKLNPELADAWRDKRGPPPDVPKCGYRSDLCAVSNLSQGITIAVSCAVPVLVAIGLALIAYWKYMELQETRNLWWYLDLHNFESPQLQVSLHIHDLDRKPAAAKLQKDNKPADKRRLYQKQPVTLEQFSDQVLSAEKILDRKALRPRLILLKHFHHDNITRFIGICTSTNPNIGSYAVYEYGARDTLHVFLHNDRITIDQTLQSSMIWEIINGLRFLQNSSLKQHGMLSSLNIMMDKRFSVRISSYALAKFRKAFGGHIFPTNLPLDPTMLWAAPEILLANKTSGSREGDVYSLGVIMTEIFTKRTPLSTNLDDYNSIKENISLLKEKPSKVRIDEVSEVPKNILPIIESCIDPDHSKRPTLSHLVSTLSRVLSNRKLVDTILRRLENYANDLENMVEARTHDLLEEQRKVDVLLKEMIPASLINSLRNKQIVNAEDFDCVTILFSDIPQFGPICAQSAPLHTIILLNTLYSTFDMILPKFDVYKVETINDSYLLASGLPIRNGIQHAGEIARMGLAMRDATETISSPLNSAEKLQLRVGINSGHCAAGVVGLKMPRYCLFGDTINTASRMESHGAVSKIHLSRSAKDLLDQLGGFVTESRGNIVVKGKGQMETFWLTSTF